MKKLVILSVLAFASPALASDLATGMVVGNDMTAIKTSLVAMGYDVRKSELENGLIEVYVVKDNKRIELYVDPQSGKVARIKSK